ncbi:Fic family protein [Methylorubrum thiocyanatum]|uniref:Fido domain-containing protein n=1 Tax=Methylorubrum thiocyanatum TaxID=47958 RepID=A0AA40S0P4_9HYPH|nr:Fic family protein [Methylorubrum thiocyanatum]MBA8912223.1 hypothetical protein [Methylorubrum thiocyanatum]
MTTLPPAPYPSWEISAVPGSDALLQQRCPELLTNLAGLSDEQFIVSLSDPRDIHRQLFKDLTPEGFPEYAGNFRGSSYPSLQYRRLGVNPAISALVGPSLSFSEPDAVERTMSMLASLIGLRFRRPVTDGQSAADAFATVFRLFGRTHPFLDGNGHVQRVMFQGMVERWGLKLRQPFVHPRPYDIEMGVALANNDDTAIAAVLATYVV